MAEVLVRYDIGYCTLICEECGAEVDFHAYDDEISCQCGATYEGLDFQSEIHEEEGQCSLKED